MATTRDVARLAGVSVSTVSYALSGTRPVTAGTKERVEAAMAELGFQPNALARGLASRRSRTLAVVYPATEAGISGTVAEFVSSAATAARQHGYHLVLWPFGAHEGQAIGDLVRQGMADGVLLMEVCLADARVAALRAAGVPFTMIGRTADADVARLAYVDIDFDRTFADAVGHLVALGHRRVGFVNHSAASHAAGYAPTLRAEAAFRAATDGHGIAGRSVLCDEDPGAGRRAAAALLDVDPALTAVVTMNELATFGVVVELASRGLAVPDGVSVLAVATSPGVGALSNPALTTLHAPGARLGRLAVRSLLALLADPAVTPEPALVTCALAPGASTAPPRTAVPRGAP